MAWCDHGRNPDECMYCMQEEIMPAKTVYDKQKQSRDDVMDVGFDMVSWLKAEMMDQYDKVYCEEVLGPALFGEGNFDVVRNEGNNAWEVRAKPGHTPEVVKGILGTNDIVSYEVKPLTLQKQEKSNDDESQ